MNKSIISRQFAFTVTFVIIALVTRSEVINFMILSNSISENATISISDLWMGTFTNVRLVMYFLMPLSFSFYISSFLSISFEDDIVEYTLLRYNSRLEYLRVKLMDLFIKAIIFFLHWSVTSIVVWYILGHSFAQESYYYLYIHNQLNGLSISQLYIIFITKIIVGIYYIGIINLAIYLGTKNRVIPFIIILVMSFIQTALYNIVDNDLILAWLPFSQYVHGLNVSYIPFGLNVSYYSSFFQFSYLTVSNIVGMVVANFLFNNFEIKQHRKGEY